MNDGESVMRTDVIAVYGPTGYTGRQVVDELRRRGFGLLLVGRDSKRLRAAAQGSGAEARVASLDDPMKLGRAFDGAAAVINCVGPFQASAEPVVAAAVSAGRPVLTTSTSRLSRHRC
jgi:short subunit dehydrogenase-like uncharacterized protein